MVHGLLFHFSCRSRVAVNGFPVSVVKSRKTGSNALEHWMGSVACCEIDSHAGAQGNYSGHKQQKHLLPVDFSQKNGDEQNSAYEHCAGVASRQHKNRHQQERRINVYYSLPQVADFQLKFLLVICIYRPGEVHHHCNLHNLKHMQLEAEYADGPPGAVELNRLYRPEFQVQVKKDQQNQRNDKAVSGRSPEEVQVLDVVAYQYERKSRRHNEQLSLEYVQPAGGVSHHRKP